MPSTSEPFSTRPLEKEDVLFVLSLSKARIQDSHLDEKGIEEYLHEDFLKGILLLDGEEKAGYCLYRQSDYDGEIDEIAILKKEEGKGAGTFLLQKALDLLDDGRRREVFLEAREGNTRARKLYESLSFEGYRRRVNYYGNEDSICYRKELGRK